MAKNVYIHIPFCKSKCNYCSFVSFNRLELREDYVEALIKQIKSEYGGEQLNTLYFGGGTPSTLSVKNFENIISLFNVDKDSEITVEMNPEGIDEDYLNKMNVIGVNRVSFGSQSFDDGILKLIGRRHNSKQIEKALNLARKVGFKNISLDLIYGLPTQTLEGFKFDLNHAISLNIEHVSLYGLKIEEDCHFHLNPPKGLANLDEQADMYLLAIETLKTSGFEHYEISNFSKQGFNSIHNLNYWDNNTYYGFGVSASGYLNGLRYTNETDLEKYIQNPTLKHSEQKLTNEEILEETIFLGFRKIVSGLNVEKINTKFNIDFENQYKKILEKYLETGHILKTKLGYTLSNEGILVSNDILAEFI